MAWVAMMLLLSGEGCARELQSKGMGRALLGLGSRGGTESESRNENSCGEKVLSLSQANVGVRGFRGGGVTTQLAGAGITIGNWREIEEEVTVKQENERLRMRFPL